MGDDDEEQRADGSDILKRLHEEAKKRKQAKRASLSEVKSQINSEPPKDGGKSGKEKRKSDAAETKGDSQEADALSSLTTETRTPEKKRKKRKPSGGDVKESDAETVGVTPKKRKLSGDGSTPRCPKKTKKARAADGSAKVVKQSREENEELDEGLGHSESEGGSDGEDETNAEKDVSDVEEDEGEGQLRTEVGGFTVIGEVKPKKTEKVRVVPMFVEANSESLFSLTFVETFQCSAYFGTRNRPGFAAMLFFLLSQVHRVLPQWLAAPSLVSGDIRGEQEEFSDVPGLNATLLSTLRENGISKFFPGQSRVYIGLQDSRHTWRRSARMSSHGASDSSFIPWSLRLSLQFRRS